MQYKDLLQDFVNEFSKNTDIGLGLFETSFQFFSFVWMYPSASGVTVSMGASQALDPGSTPGWRKYFFYFFFVFNFFYKISSI